MQRHVRNRNFAGLLPVALCLVALAGCNRNSGPQVSRSEGGADEASITTPQAETIVPLPRVAEEHPAPDNTPGLDVAETAQAAALDDPQKSLELAFSYYKAKAYADAAPAFERAARLSPKNPTPLLFLGYTQMAVGALEPARATFERVTQVAGVSRSVISEARYQQGVTLAAQGKDADAVKAYTQSIGHNTHNGLASLALGGWAAQNKRWNQARSFFNDAAKDLPSGAKRAQAFAALGRLAEDAKDKKSAIVAYKKALKDDEDARFAREGLARLGVTVKG